MQRRLSLSMLPKRVVAHTRLEDDGEVESLYEFVSLLGQGSFGAVHLARHSATGAEWAIKVLDKKKAGTAGVRMLEFEIGILKRVSHEHIVSLKEVFETPRKSYLVLELCRGGTLQDHYLTEVRRPAYSQQDVSVLIQRLAGAVAYLHDNDIAHRDLKLDNIMLDPTPEDPLVIKVTDFGLCAVKSRDMPAMQMVCGTPSYMAPEVLADNGTYSPLCDIWSTGVILYNLLSGVLPFRGDDKASLEEKIEQGLVLFPDDPWASIDPAAKDLVTNCLRVDPARRITAKEMLDHPWLTGARSPLMGGTVLEMMKQHAITERRGATLGAELLPPVLAAETLPAAGQEEKPISTPCASPPPIRSSRLGSRTKSQATSPAPPSAISPTPTSATRPLPNYMRPTKASGGAPWPESPSSNTRIVRLPSEKRSCE